MFLDLLHKTEESTKKGCVMIVRMFRFVNKTPSQNKNKAKTLLEPLFKSENYGELLLNNDL